MSFTPAVLKTLCTWQPRVDISIALRILLTFNISRSTSVKSVPWQYSRDNLRCHEDYQLIEFCAEKKIHLINFPAKTSHILQPLDKVFGLLKVKIDQKKDEALLLNQGNISKSKVPILVRFALNSIKPSTVQQAFADTGVFPLNRSAIDNSLLVGGAQQKHEIPPTTSKETPQLRSEITKTNLAMHVYDENDNEMVSNHATSHSISTQTSPIERLPCSSCIENDVAVHPAVTAGIVPLDLASVFIDRPGMSRDGSSKKNHRDIGKGRILTHESEMQRMRERQDLEKEKQAEKMCACRNKRTK